MRNDRKLVGMTADLHEFIHDIAKANKIPATAVIDHCIRHAHELIDWKEVKAELKRSAMTWQNMRKALERLKLTTPEPTDSEVMQFIGCSRLQAEVLTMTAHKRVLDVMRQNPDIMPKPLSTQSNVSEKFALRIWHQAQGISKVSKEEQVLWDMSVTPPVPKHSL